MAGKRLAATQPLGKNLIHTWRVNLELKSSMQGLTINQGKIANFQRVKNKVTQSQGWVSELQYGICSADLHSGNYVHVHKMWPGSAAYNS